MKRILTFLLLMLTGVALATTGHLIDLTCPVCGTKTQGTEMFSTNTAAGADRDLLQRAGGGQPLLLSTVTCPQCHYSASEGSFAQPVDPRLAAWVKAGVKVPAYKTYPSERFTEGLRAKDQPPAWVSHALIAEQMRFMGAPADDVSHRDMQVVWSMRFELNPLDDLAGEEGWKLIREAGQTAPDQNRADAELALSRQALANLDKFPADKRGLVVGTAAFLLRAHGENVDVLAALDSYEPTGPTAENWKSVAAETREAIALERTYQAKALASLNEAIAASQEPAVLIYLTGELHRRMGDRDAARAAYARAASEKGLPDWLKTWVTEQAALVK